MAIIDCADWKDALSCEWKGDKGTNPFKELIKEMPGKHTLIIHN